MSRHRIRAAERKGRSPLPAPPAPEVELRTGLRHRIDVAALLSSRLAGRVEALRDDWLDEASQAALSGNPRRAHYLELMARRVPQLVQERVRATGGKSA